MTQGLAVRKLSCSLYDVEISRQVTRVHTSAQLHEGLDQQLAHLLYGN